jgi:antirestriction protein
MSDKSMIRFEKIKNIFQNNVYVADYEAVARDYESLTGRIEKYRDNYDATEVLNRMKQTRGE